MRDRLAGRPEQVDTGRERLDVERARAPLGDRVRRGPGRRRGIARAEVLRRSARGAGQQGRRDQHDA